MGYFFFNYEEKTKQKIYIFLVIFEDKECQGLCGENGTKSTRDHSHITFKHLKGRVGSKIKIIFKYLFNLLYSLHSSKGTTN